MLKATGKATVLVESDKKWARIVGIANGYIDQWQYETSTDWSSLYEKSKSFGQITATNTYAIPDDVRKISDTPGDFIYIKTSSGQMIAFSTVLADELNQYEGLNICAQVGKNLVFGKTFSAEDAEFGGEILVPVYKFAESLTTGSSVIPVDIPRWLVIITAAEYVRNDITKQSQFPNLISEANGLMERMIDDNDAQVSFVYAPWIAGGGS